MRKRTRDGRVALYRHYDGQGVLLYVGISDDAEHRRRQHVADGAPWWRFAVRYEVMLYASRRQAEEAERAAIRAARPLFNITHNDKSTTLRAVKYLIEHDALDLLAPIRGESVAAPQDVESQAGRATVAHVVEAAEAHRAEHGVLPKPIDLTRTTGASRATVTRALKKIRETPPIHLVKSTG